MAVVLFHCGLGIPGGFVGVDIFFVISGFLITSLILKDLQQGTFSMVRFWERRARRILPASIVMVFVTTVAGWFLLLPSDFVSFGKSAASQTVFAANFFFWRTTNYFAGPADQQPLLHTWSLAVEEQFYMVVPVLLFLLWKFHWARSRTFLFIILGGGFLVSLALSIVILPRLPAVTFYLLPTRAWELLCGSLVALVPARAFLQGRLLREVLVALGIAGMLVPCFLYSKETAFPGLAAVPPCLGAVLFILGCSPSSATPLPRTAVPFIWKPVVFVGLISYSLYLWHWPLVAFSHYWALEDLPLWHRWTIVIVSFFLAVISWKWVETPFRKRTLGGTRKTMFLHAGVGLAAVALAGVLLVLLKGFPTRFSERVYSFDQAKAEALHANRICGPLTLEEARDGRIPRLGAPEPAPVGLLVWGDSHARSILPAAIALAEIEGVGVLGAWHSSTAPVIDYIPDARYAGYSLGQDSPAWASAIIEQVKERRITQVLLVAQWSGYFHAEEERLKEGKTLKVPIGKALIKTIRALRDLDAGVWILREVPNHAAPVPKTLIKSELFGTLLSSYACTHAQLDTRNASFDQLHDELVEAGGQILDVSTLLENGDSGCYRMEMNGVALYYDSHHLTQAGARLLAPALRSIFDGIELSGPE